MVLNLLRWCFRSGVVASAFAPGGIVSAQTPAPGSLAALQQTVVQRTAEWNTLAANLEQRVARLLPCDPQARAAIEEAGRASDARIIAAISYWTVAALRSKTQVEAERGLLAEEEEKAGAWLMDSSQATLDVSLAKAQGASLATSVSRIPAFANPQRDLEAIAEQYRVLEKQAQDRAAAHARLIEDLRSLLSASQARQQAIDLRLKTVGTEGQHWSAYYAARQARAQIECTLINPAAVAGPPAFPRSAPQGKKQ